MAGLLQNLLGSTIVRLSPLSDTPQLDAQVLLAHVTNKPRTWIVANPNFTLEVDQAEKLN
jgi:hypothetical protein